MVCERARRGEDLIAAGLLMPAGHLILMSLTKGSRRLGASAGSVSAVPGQQRGSLRVMRLRSLTEMMCV